MENNQPIMHTAPTIQLGVSGEYTLERIKNGEVIDQMTFTNIITDSGLNLLASPGDMPALRCVVGTGNTQPLPSDTSLANQVGAQGSSEDDVNIYPYYDAATQSIVSTIQWLFPVGAATGNISEVGVTTNNSPYTMFSRSLVKDRNGNPTSITVLADEQLRVVYRCSIYPGSKDLWTGTVGGYDVLIRPARNTTPSNHYTYDGWAIITNRRSLRTPSTNNTAAYTTLFTNGAIGPASGAPSGTIISYTASNTSRTITSYPGTGSYSVTLVFFPTTANSATGIKCMELYGRDFGPIDIQMQFTPPIMKTANDRLTISITVQFTRKPD